MRFESVLTIAVLLGTQTITRPEILPAFTPRESSPAFVVGCHNNSAAPVPWPMVQKIRLDGKERELTGGIVGSLVGTPDERFEVAPGAVHRMLLVISSGTEGSSTSPGQGLDARVRQGWIVPLTPGRHRLAVECLGQWSDEITFAWSPDAPFGR